MPKGIYKRKNAHQPKYCLDCAVKIDWRSTYCRACCFKGERNPVWTGGFDKKGYQAKYYQLNKETILEQVSTWKAGRLLQIRDLLDKYKGQLCMDCHQNYPPYVMDFDHVRGAKLFNLGRAMGLGVSIEAVQEEIEKCDVVCANCHRERTYGGGKSSRIRWLDRRAATE
jgi:hypothetical protein